MLFITTANDLGSIPGPLRDRMDVIELPSYTRVEKYNIARKHLLPKQLKACGLSGKVTFSQSALYGIIDGYTREAGVRNLERTITSVLRKCARKIAAGEVESVSVTGTMLEQLLGPRFVKPDFLNRTNAVGIANGLAWTSVGGETLPIEVQVMDKGSGKITVTGSLGDVMKESAQLAVTWVRVHADEYGIDPEKPQEMRSAYPCPGGRSAQGRPFCRCHPDHGAHVLPVWHPGARRCCHDGRDHPPRQCAAHRRPAGKEHGGLPRGHEDGPHPQGQPESDLYEVDDEVKKNIEFLPMSNLSQVLAAALLKPKNGVCGPPAPMEEKKGPLRLRPLPPTAEKPAAGRGVLREKNSFHR